jgi:hypothetical protein
MQIRIIESKMSKHFSAPNEKGVRRFQSMIIHDVEENEQIKRKIPSFPYSNTTQFSSYSF